MSVITYKYGRVPEALLYSDASDRACRLHAILTRWADTRPDDLPTREQLAEQLHCSVDSADRALKELENLKFLRVERDRFDRVTGGQLPNRYILEGAARVPRGGRKAAAPSSPAETSKAAGKGSSTGAQGGGRTGAAVNKDEGKALTQKEEEHHVEPPARPDVDELCVLLADRIIANGGTEARYRNRPGTKAWQDPMRRLIDLDGIKPDRVRKAIEWAQDDDFWRAVILSPDNLRRKFDQLRLAAQRANGNGHHNGAGNGRISTVPEADLSSRPPLNDPEALMAYYDRQLEEASP